MTEDEAEIAVRPVGSQLELAASRVGYSEGFELGRGHGALYRGEECGWRVEQWEMVRKDVGCGKGHCWVRGTLQLSSFGSNGGDQGSRLERNKCDSFEIHSA